jgi:hypothetical protein
MPKRLIPSRSEASPTLPVLITMAQAEAVAGGTIPKSNPGPGTASYNTPGNPDYGVQPSPPPNRE